MVRIRPVLGAIVGVPLSVLILAEVADQVLDRSRVGVGQGTPVTVMALGHRNGPGGIDAINRWRVESALLTAGRLTADRLLLVGGDPGGGGEAVLMSGHARHCGWDGPIDLETTSRTTVENIEFSLPFLERAGTIAIVSNPLHAFRARRMLVRRRPDLASRLVRSDHSRRGVWMIGVPVGTLVETAVLLRRWVEARLRNSVHPL